MTQQWIAGILIAFGIFVAVFGVIAYLRMIRATRRSEGTGVNDFPSAADSEQTPRKAHGAVRLPTQGDQSD